MSEPKTRKVARSLRTGRFVKKSTAKRHPDKAEVIEMPVGEHVKTMHLLQERGEHGHFVGKKEPDAE